MRWRTSYPRGVLAVAMVLMVATVLPVVRDAVSAPGPRLLTAITAVGDDVAIDLRLEGVEGVAGYEIELVGEGATFRAPRVPAGDPFALDELDGRTVLAAVALPDDTGTDGVVDLGGVRSDTETGLTIRRATFVDAAGTVLAHLESSTLVATGSGSVPLSSGDDAPVEVLAAGPSAPSPSPDAYDPAEIVIDWELAHLGQDVCGTSSPADVTGDGCVDIADLVTAGGTSPQFARSSAGGSAGTVFTVDSTGDEWDVNAGNGVCRTAAGTCTLRAALHESKNFPGQDRIEFAIPGPGPHTISIGQALPRLSEGGTVIDGYSQPGATPNTDPFTSDAQLMIAIDGGLNANTDALVVFSADNVIQGLSIHGVRRPIWVSGFGHDRNVIRGNFVGIDPAGGGAWPTLEEYAHGIHVEQDAADTIIGGPDPGDRNVVSGNGRHGIGFWHNRTDRFVVQGNIVGLSPDGSTAIPNRKHGIDLNFGTSGGRIGGSGPGEANVVSGNDDSAIEVSHLVGTTANVIEGNRIGTSLDGETAPPHAANANIGIAIEDAASGNSFVDNTIVNSGVAGVVVRNGGTNGNSADNVFTGNRIGVLPSGAPAPNVRSGVTLSSSGTVVGPDNEIRFNGGNGVEVTEIDGIENTITRNEIADNGLLGIDVAPLGAVNPNDPGDADTGANTKLNSPEFMRTTNQIVQGTACASCVVEIFESDGSASAGSGASLLTTVSANTTGEFSVALLEPGPTVGSLVTATATDPAGNTSEFSLNATVEFHNDPPSVTIDPTDPVDEGGSVDVSAAAIDPDGDDVSFEWDLDDDGVFETPGDTVSFSAAGIDGPSSAPIAVRATDVHGAETVATSAVSVVNVDPSATLQVDATVDEGAPAAVVVADPVDPSPADASTLRFAVACDGSSLDGVTYRAAAPESSFDCVIDDGPSVPTIRVRVIDDDEGFSEYTATIDVANVAPTVTVALSGGTLAEGDLATFGATVTDPSTTDTAAGFITAWVATLGGVSIADGSGDAGSFTVEDDGALAIDVTATDADGDTGAGGWSGTVTGVAPTASLGSTTSGPTSTVTFTNPVDPSVADTAAGFHYAFDCDGGSLAGTTYAEAGPSATTDCTYDDGLGSHLVTAVIVDDDDDATTYTVSVGDGNQPPSVTVAPSFTVAEGGSVTLRATGNDPEQGPLTFEWDLDDDGVFETAGTTPLFDAASLDGPVVVPVAVRAVDAAGAAAVASSQVQVTNVAPTGVLAHTLTDEATPVTIAVTDAADVSSDDAAALRFAFSCDGSSLAAVTYADAGGSATAECLFDDGLSANTVRARVLDDDGGVADLSATVTVANVSPTAAVVDAPATADEGDVVDFEFSVDDVSAADVAAGLTTTWQAALDGVVVAQGSGVTGSLTLGDDGTLVVTATVTDKNAGTGTADFTVDVGNLDPSGILTVPATADEGDTITADFSDLADPGASDVADLHFAISCDGSSLAGTTHAEAGADPSPTCQLQDDGTTAIEGVILDDDGGSVSVTAEIEVTGVAPQARFLAPITVVEDDDLVLGADQVSDPSPADAAAGAEFSFDCADGSGSTPFSSTATVTCSPTTPGPLPVSMQVRDVDGAVRAYPAVVVVEPELVVNPGFDDDVNANGVADGWSLHPSLTLVSAGARSGLAIQHGGPGSASSFTKSTTIPVLAGRNYSVAAWVDTPAGGNRSVKMRVRWFRGDGGLIRTSLIGVQDVATAGYQPLSSEVVAPATAASAWVEFETTTSGATVRIDDTTMVAGNQQGNADFEAPADPTGKPPVWTPISRLVVATDPVHGGTQSGALLADGTAYFSARQKSIAVTPGETVGGGFWLQVPEGVDILAVRSELRWMTSAESNISVTLLDAVNDPTPGWIHVWGTDVAPAGAGTARLEIRVVFSTGTMYLDDVYFGPV